MTDRNTSTHRHCTSTLHDVALLHGEPTHCCAILGLELVCTQLLLMPDLAMAYHILANALSTLNPLGRENSAHHKRPMSPPPRTWAMAHTKPRSSSDKRLEPKDASIDTPYEPYLQTTSVAYCY